MSRRVLGALVALLAVCGPLAAAARPYTVKDLLHEESFGASRIDPSGRWLVLERRDAYDSGTRFDYDHQIPTALTRLLRVDLAHPRPAQPLLSGQAPRGLAIGAFSPSGAQLAIYQLHDDRWTLGVVTVATGAVRWFKVTPEQSVFARTLQWLSDSELVVIDRPDGTPPFAQRLGHLSADVLPARWRASASGQGSWTTLGSGAYRAERPRPSPRQLIRLNVRTGVRTVLATGEFTDLEVSPDGRRVAVLAAGADLQPRAAQPLQGDWGIETQQSDLSIVEVKTRQASRPCPKCDVLPLLLDWSPSGRSLLIYARAEGAPWTAGHLQVIDAAAGQVSSPAEGLRLGVGGRPTAVRAGWLGEEPLVWARPDGGGRDDWFRLTSAGPVNLTVGFATAPSELQAVGAEGLAAVIDGALWRVDRSGTATRLLSDVRAAPDGRSGPQGRLAYRLPDASKILVQTSAGPELWRVDLASAARIVGLPAASGALLASSAAHHAAVVREIDSRRVETVRVLASDAAPRTVATVNADLAKVDPPRVRRIDHQAPDGRRLTSWLFLPPPAPDRRPPPLVVKVYSGDVYASPPADLPPPNGLLTNIGTLVGHGYAVLTPSLPWPKSRGEPLAGLADRILAVVDQAAADPTLAGAFDPNRLAIWGHSYGGYTVLAAIGQTHRFRAAVSLAGFSDLISQWGAFPGPWGLLPEQGVHTGWTAGWVETSQGDMGAPPWADPARYLRNSPLFAAGYIETPLLQVHGDQDDLPMGQADSMFSALYRQNKDALLITYWGEGHLISSPGNVEDFFRRAFAFLDARLEMTAPVGAAPGRSREGGPASGGPRTRPLRR